jgi:uncharacterized cupredoxin-like copper-binding protein
VRQLHLLIVTATIAALVVSCAAAPQGGVVNATLTEMKITLDRASVPAGPVTFNVKNSGTVEHELVVLHTDLAEGKIPPDPEEPGKVDETGSLGESGEVAAGASKSFTLTLPAGSYVLICNEPGHYAAGMHLAFTVK